MKPADAQPRWLDRHERQPGEEPPLGLTLCAGKSGERTELLEQGQKGPPVAEYLAELMPKAVPQQRLHEAVARPLPAGGAPRGRELTRTV